MTKASQFTQADIARAVRGVKAAGETVSRVEIENGRIVVHCVEAGYAMPRVNPLDRILGINPWDQELER